MYVRTFPDISSKQLLNIGYLIDIASYQGSEIEDRTRITVLDRVEGVQMEVVHQGEVRIFTSGDQRNTLYVTVDDTVDFSVSAQKGRILAVCLELYVYITNNDKYFRK